MFLNFCLRDPHVNHVRHQFNGALDGAGIEVSIIGNRSLNAKLLQTSSEIIHFALQTGGIYVGQGEQLVDAGPHHLEEGQGRL